MSEAQRECGFYIDDMIGFVERVIAYTANMDQAGFVGNQLVYDATLRNLEHVVSDVPVLLAGLRALKSKAA
jgi:uncharacterized protein with HEPN domain